MVEFYDPDRRGERPVEAAAPPAGARVEGPPPSTSPSSGPPVLELVLVGVAVLLVVVATVAQGVPFGGESLGLMLLYQFVYPLSGALFTAAVVSLLLRRPLRRQRAELSAELDRLHAELATLRAATAGDGR